MAVSHKTNNLINCNRCHLPFNFKNSMPKILSCKHWYCVNCLEHLLYTAKDTYKYIECIQCQKSIDNIQEIKDEKSKIQLMPYNNNNINHNHIINNNGDNNNMAYFSCDNEFAQRDYELDDTNKTRRSASLASENSSGSFTYFNTTITNNNSNNKSNNNNNNNNNNNKNNSSNSSSSNNSNGYDLDENLHLRNHIIGSGISTNISEKILPGENCFIHGMPNTLWCQTCFVVLCRGCNAGLEHKDHKVENQLEAKEFYQNRVKQEFVQFQVNVEEMENLKLLQKSFLLKILETCCTLKLQIEHELMATSNTADIDDVKDTMKNLQLSFGLLDKQTPNEILKLYKIFKDENNKLKLKHKQMLQQCKMEQFLSRSEKILDFEMMREIFQKFDSTYPIPDEFNNMAKNLFTYVEDENRESNSIMILTNYCIYRLYMSYVKQQQQFIEEQVLRYQQYHQEQKQNLLKQYKMLQQQNTAILALQNQNQTNHHQDYMVSTNEFTTFYNQDKPKTYAEIATPPKSHQFETNDSSNGFELIPTTSNNFQPNKNPLTKTYEEPSKTVQLLFNPINNENNQIYFFDFERNGIHLGRVLIKVFADIAPKMSYNFHALATHEKGFGYIGCKVFECHPNESIITGDIEQNTGYSSRSIYEDVQFVPDETNIAPFAGAVGMRRAKKKFHSQGLVGSQFRIILTELGFTAIFGCVIEGIDVIKKISQTTVQNDKIHGNTLTTGSVNSGIGSTVNNGTVAGIFITQCGLYEFVKRDIMCGI